MAQSCKSLVKQLEAHFGDLLVDCYVACGQAVMELKPGALLDVCRALRDQDEFCFQQLMDLCGVDYSTYGKADWETQESTGTGFSRGVNSGGYDNHSKNKPRFAVVYHFLSIRHNQRLRLRCLIEQSPPKIESVVGIWSSANWYEREAFDLFGILFDGHPDMRRILTDYGFVGHPFQKDFPLEGNVEVRYDEEQKRVVYQPVSIRNRVLVPRVIRHDSRYQHTDSKKVAPDA